MADALEARQFDAPFSWWNFGDPTTDAFDPPIATPTDDPVPTLTTPTRRPRPSETETQTVDKPSPTWAPDPTTTPDDDPTTTTTPTTTSTPTTTRSRTRTTPSSTSSSVSSDSVVSSLSLPSLTSTLSTPSLLVPLGGPASPTGISTSLSSAFRPSAVPAASSSGNRITGAGIAGITVAALAGVAVVATLLAWMLRKQRERKDRRLHDMDDDEMFVGGTNTSHAGGSDGGFGSGTYTAEEDRYGGIAVAPSASHYSQGSHVAHSRAQSLSRRGTTRSQHLRPPSVPSNNFAGVGAYRNGGGGEMAQMHPFDKYLAERRQQQEEDAYGGMQDIGGAAGHQDSWEPHNVPPRQQQWADNSHALGHPPQTYQVGPMPVATTGYGGYQRTAYRPPSVPSNVYNR